MSRLKKAVAAKAASTGKGQAMIYKHLGEEGQNLLDLLLNYVGEHHGKSDAETMKKYIYKVLMKVAVLFDEHKIKDEDFIPVRDPLKHATFSFQDQCEMTKVMFNPPKLVGFLRCVQECLKQLLTGAYKSKKGEVFERIDWIFDFLNEQFFTDLFQEKGRRETVDDAASILHAIIRKLQVTRPAEEEEEGIRAEGVLGDLQLERKHKQQKA